MIRYITKTRLSIIMTLLMFVIFTLNSVTLAAANDILNAEGLAGIWSGVIKGEDVRADFTITPSKDNNGPDQYSLHYGAPRTCRLEAEELSKSDSDIRLIFNEANGGFCDRLYHGKMVISVDNDDNLSVLITSRSGDIKESAILTRR